MKILIALDESPVSARQRERRPACSPWQVPTFWSPADAAEAKETAGEFVLALFRDDIARMTQLATPGYADRLAEPAASGGRARQAPAGQLRVMAVQTEEFRGDVGLLQVLVERDVPALDRSAAQQVQLVNVVVLRVDGGWRVDDAAF